LTGERRFRPHEGLPDPCPILFGNRAKIEVGTKTGIGQFSRILVNQHGVYDSQMFTICRTIDIARTKRRRIEMAGTKPQKACLSISSLRKDPP